MTACLRCAISAWPGPPVQHGALAEQRGLRRVQVLGPVVVGVELARAERDYVAGQVADGPHQPAAETVKRTRRPSLARPAVIRSVSVKPRHAGAWSGLPRPSASSRRRTSPRPRARSRARTGTCGQVQRLACATARRRTRRRRGARRSAGGAGSAPDQERSHPARSAGRRRPAGQQLDASTKDSPSIFCTNLIASPPSGTRKAVEESARRGHVERGGLLLMERAQALERAAACVAQLKILTDHFVDGRPLANRRDILVADPPSHHPPPRRTCVPPRV